jgi:hypothetical protein
MSKTVELFFTVMCLCIYLYLMLGVWWVDYKAVRLGVHGFN